MRRLVWSVLFLSLSVFSGCSTVAGKWTLVTVEPEAARREIEYASLTLQKDGSFYAEAQNDVPGTDVVVVTKDTTVVTETDKPGIQSTSGTYEFKDNTLALRPHEGKVVAYDAKLDGGSQLKLEKFYGAQKVKCTFKRVE